jgi:hypothetical protein
MEVGDYIQLIYGDDETSEEEYTRIKRNEWTVHGVHIINDDSYCIGIAYTKQCTHKDLQLRVLRDADLLDKIPIEHVNKYFKLDGFPDDRSLICVNNCLELHVYKIINALLKNECSIHINFNTILMIKLDHKKVQSYSLEKIEKDIIEELLKKDTKTEYYKLCCYKFYSKEQKWLTKEGKSFSRLLKNGHIDKQKWIFQGIQDWTGSIYI